MGALPLLDGALGRGELSYAKTRALTRVATPDNEQQLLELARYSTGAQLERILRGYRSAVATNAEEGLAEERSVRERVLPGGMVRLELVLCPDEAALVLKAIEKARDVLRDGVPAETPSEADHVSAETPIERAKTSAQEGAAAEQSVVSRADAAVLMAESFLANGIGAGTSNGGERYQLLVHLDQDVLAPDAQWAATLEDGTHLSGENLRRLACDAGLVPRRTDAAGSSLDVGRRTRSIAPAIRRALWLRDRGCRFPGCTHVRFLHGHHIRHWLHGGATRLDNLVLLCSRHRLVAVPRPQQVEDAMVALRIWESERGIEIGPDSNLPWWDGAVPDYDMAVSSLISAG